MLYSLVRPALFRIEAERAHSLALNALKLMPGGRPAEPGGPLAVEVRGHRHRSGIGRARGDRRCTGYRTGR